MNYLKITQAGWAGYTGPLGMVEFADGLSTHPVPRVQADRITGLIGMVECDEGGNELGETGIAHRLVEEANERAPTVVTLERQSDADKAEEIRRAALAGEKPPVSQFFTGAELLDIADKGGIKALREKAEPWGVKHRSLTVLIKMILDAQDVYLAERDKRMQDVASAQMEVMEEREREEVERNAAAAAKIEAETVLKGGTVNQFDEIYDIAGEQVALADLIKGAKIASGLSAVAWNQLVQNVRDELLTGHIEATRFAASQPKKVVEEIAEADPQSIDKDAAGFVESEGQIETLLGSSVLNSTYEINGEIVQLGDIVAAAHKLFGGSVDAWNVLPNDEREALLRLELDRRLPQE